MTLLALNTNVVTYDFVRARKLDNRLEGFTTTRLRSQISSDLLRGLRLSVEHDLFDAEDRNGEDQRTFDPLLAQLNLSFAMSSNSGLIQAIGRLFGGGGEEASGVAGATEADSAAALMDLDDLDPLIDNVGTFSPTDESSIIPGGGSNDAVGEDVRAPARRRRGSAWNANFSYSLRQSRDPSLVASQLLQMGFRLKPTEKWDLVWRTSYDIGERSFTDHTIRLTRDLHRWQANFDFLQTVTGNWSFRFEVSLTDNRDLKFDYDQRSTDLINPF
jgi:hypothetical protein